jgi:hypothetical protein
VETSKGEATIRGKVWEYGQAEPKGWLVEATDPRPNTEGSPTLYGYVTGIVDGTPGSDAFYDNVRVTPKKD